MSLYRLTSQALTDLRKIEAYIALDNPVAGRKIRHAIRAKCQFLGQHPHLTAPQKSYGNLSKHSCGNYIILYRPAKVGVDIIRVYHSSRDKDSLLKSLH
jgi:plasmid stabilization system protein ParE